MEEEGQILRGRGMNPWKNEGGGFRARRRKMVLGQGNT